VLSIIKVIKQRIPIKITWWEFIILIQSRTTLGPVTTNGILFFYWSSNKGTKSLFQGIDIAYEAYFNVLMRCAFKIISIRIIAVTKRIDPNDIPISISVPKISGPKAVLKTMNIVKTLLIVPSFSVP